MLFHTATGITFVFEPILAQYISILDVISFKKKVKLIYKIVFVYGLLELYYISIQVLVISSTLYLLIALQSDYIIITLFTVCSYVTILIIHIALNSVVYFTKTWWKIQISNKTNKYAFKNSFVFSIKRLFGNVTDEFSLTVMWSVIITAFTDMFLIFSSLFGWVLDEYAVDYKVNVELFNDVVNMMGKENVTDDQELLESLTTSFQKSISYLNDEFNYMIHSDPDSYFDLHESCLLICLVLFGMHVLPILVYRLCSWGVFSKNVQERVKQKSGLTFKSTIITQTATWKNRNLTSQSYI